jgi:hypothetical protein
MKLITKPIEKRLLKTPLNTHESTPPDEVPVIVKFFDPFGSATWYVTEGEQLGNDDWEFFGYVTGLTADEWGYFRLSELQALKDPIFGRFPRIERDMSFDIGDPIPDFVELAGTVTLDVHE